MPATKNANRLINESSPYLLQHAYNPVDWYPWGAEAFAKAAAEDKPVFLSIGYSTCHWCHVMEQESFADAEVAQLLQDNFIAIKVDKEERPDIDAIYMGVCQALTGSGGWPLTIVMTPEQKPFFAGTYFPKRRRYGQIGLIELLTVIDERWFDDRESLLSAGERISAFMAVDQTAAAALVDERNIIKTALEELEQNFDQNYGGFGAAPKFPMPQQLLFLLRCHYLALSKNALPMVEKTLTAMYQGGIYDHIGGGFARYATDKRWLIPHFEKMLYDNALLTLALLECYQVTGKPLYKGIAEHTLAYIKREMTSQQGGFFSAQDADIDGEEGKFYTFSTAEVSTVLGAEAAEEFCNYYGLTAEGNFEGKNTLNLLHQPEPQLPTPEIEQQLAKLLQYRAERYQLHKDDKILLSWNALMITASAKAYQVLGEVDYLQMALKAYNFLQANLRTADGKLFISYRNGQNKGQGILDDYAFLAWAALELYQATFEVKYLQDAADLMEQILMRFGRVAGGFYLTPLDGEALLFRPFDQFDGAMPSGNSVAALCLVRLAALSGEERWQKAAAEQLESYSELFSRQPSVASFALLALQQQSLPSQQLLVAAPDHAAAQKISRDWGQYFHPQTTIVAKTPDLAADLAQIAPYTVNYPVTNQPSFYLCQNYSCVAPVASLSAVLAQLAAKSYNAAAKS